METEAQCTDHVSGSLMLNYLQKAKHKEQNEKSYHEKFYRDKKTARFLSGDLQQRAERTDGEKEDTEEHVCIFPLLQNNQDNPARASVGERACTHMHLCAFIQTETQRRLWKLCTRL